MLHQRCTGAGSQRARFTYQQAPRPAIRARRCGTVCNAVSSPFKIQLRHPVKLADADERPLLVFLPGTDGTGQAIMPQLPGLLNSGYDVRTLYIPPDDRSGWDQLQAQTLYLISKALRSRQPGPHSTQVSLVAESFGGCLALRLAAAAPQLIKSVVLVNPATSYNQSLNGLSSFVAATNLLGLFPQDLYNTAQAVLLPFLVDIDRVGPDGAQALRSMIFMDKPPDYDTPGSRQLATYDDDEEQGFDTVTLSTERRRRQQLSSTATFTAAGQHSGNALAAPASYLDPKQNHNSSRGISSQGWGASDRSRGGVFRTTAGGAGSGGGSLFAPAAAANFRANLMRQGNLSDRVLKAIEVPCLVLSSAKDRMLPSLAEGARLARLLPHSSRVILPDSGHAALLERGMDLAAVMRASGIIPSSVGPTAFGARGAAAGASRPGSNAGAAKQDRTAAAAAVAATDQRPVLLGVKNDQAVVGGSSSGNNGNSGTADVPLRPATVFPSIATPTAAAAAATPAAAATAQPSTAAGSTASLDTSQVSVSVGAASSAAATVAATFAATAGGAASMAANPDGRSSRAALAVPSSSNGNSHGSSNSIGSNEKVSSSRVSAGPSELEQDRLSTVSSAGGGGGGSNGKQRQQTVPGDKNLAWDQWSQYLAPWRDLVSPVLLGQDHLPGLVNSHRPLLFVGNHQKMGLYDMPLLAYELYMRGFMVKGLAHPGHWGGPLGPFFEQFGAVKAGPMTAYKLLKAGEQVLLFPGGAREVNKRVGQEYQLFWKETADFVRLAARCDAIIVPFAAVGADDAYDVFMEADELVQTPVIGDLIKAGIAKLDPNMNPAEAALPITKLPGLGLPTLVPVPNLQRLYFKICKPVDTRDVQLTVKGDAEGWQELYDSIKGTVVGGMQELLEVRAADDQQDVGARIRKTVQSWLPAFSLTKADNQNTQI